MNQRAKGLAQRLERLNELQLDEVERLVARLESAGTVESAKKHREKDKESGDESPHSKDWPHAPTHRLIGKATCIVTAGTLNKEHHYRDAESLDFLECELLKKAKEYYWQLEA